MDQVFLFWEYNHPKNLSGMMPRAGRTVCKTEPHRDRDSSIPLENATVCKGTKQPHFQCGHLTMCAGSSPVRSTKGLVEQRQFQGAVTSPSSEFVGLSPTQPTKMVPSSKRQGFLIFTQEMRIRIPSELQKSTSRLAVHVAALSRQWGVIPSRVRIPSGVLFYGIQMYDKYRKSF